MQVFVMMQLRRFSPESERPIYLERGRGKTDKRYSVQSTVSAVRLGFNTGFGR